MPFTKLKVDEVTPDSRIHDRILRHDAAIVLDLNLHVLTRKNLRAEIEDHRESPGRQPMIEIIAKPGLKQADLGPVVHNAAAIDEALRDVSDFRDMKMRRDLIAIGQVETRIGGWS
jgi:hypothetical protein